MSVSLSDRDVAFLDQHAEKYEVDSRSAVVQKAIALLRKEQLGDEYEQAFEEWFGSEDAELWDRTVGDGIEDDDATW